MSQLSQLPEKAQNGSFLHRDSTGGDKLQLVQQTSESSTSFTIAAGGTFNIVFDFDAYDTDIPKTSRSASNVIQFADAVTWPFADVYVDTDANGNFHIGWGGSLSAGQQKILMMTNFQETPSIYSGSVRYTASTHYMFYNFDASPHTLYWYGLYKFILRI